LSISKHATILLTKSEETNNLTFSISKIELTVNKTIPSYLSADSNQMTPMTIELHLN